MRKIAPATILCGIILLSGCAATGSPAAAPSARATATATPTPTATASAAPLTEPEEVTKQTTNAVTLYSQLVCNNLTEHPDVDLNAAVDQLLSTYATENLSEEARLQLAHNVLEQSAAKDCPDQSDRIAESLAAG